MRRPPSVFALLRTQRLAGLVAVVLALVLGPWATAVAWSQAAGSTTGPVEERCEERAPTPGASQAQTFALAQVQVPRRFERPAPRRASIATRDAPPPSRLDPLRKVPAWVPLRC